MKIVGVIGGSGLYEIEGLTNVESVAVDTPWGSPSDDLIVGNLGDTKMVFLPRHGRGHKQMPSEINYRANIFAMKKMGVEWIVSVSAVGSMKEHIFPGQIVIPSQFYDHTKTRVSTFFGDGIVAHVSMADPVCHQLSDELYNASISARAIVHKGGTYLCMEGPQFSSRAESDIYRSWGVDIIGMTNATEAKLAREAEICYASLSMATDYDCWHEQHDNVTVEDLIETLNSNVQLARNIIKTVVPLISESRECPCCDALKNAIITPKEVITQEARERLKILIKRYL